MAKSVLRRSGVRRSTVAAARVCVERRLIPLRPDLRSNLAPRILFYHSTGTKSWGVNDVRPEQFRRQIELALRNGRRFVSAQTIAAGNGKDGDLAITFDDGLRSAGKHAAPILRDLDIPWTMFVVTGWADGNHDYGNVMLNWRELELLANRGGTLASHSVSHPNFAYITPAETVEELFASRDILERRLGIRTNEFAIPLGLAQDWPDTAAEIATRAGYTTVYAQAESLRAPGTMPRTFISKFDHDRSFLAAINGAFDTWQEFR